MKENYNSAFIVILISVLVGLFVWLVCSIYDSYNSDRVTFVDCKEIKIDTISYNYRDSTYVLQVDVKY